MYEKTLAAGGLLAAIAASTCCSLPLVLGSLGIGGAVLASLSVLSPYQTVLRLAAVALLGTGFWLAYARKPVLADGVACAPSRSSAWAKPALWVGVVVLGVVLSEPVWARWFA